MIAMKIAMSQTKQNSGRGKEDAREILQSYQPCFHK